MEIKVGCGWVDHTIKKHNSGMVVVLEGLGVHGSSGARGWVFGKCRHRGLGLYGGQDGQRRMW